MVTWSAILGCDPGSRTFNIVYSTLHYIRETGKTKSKAFIQT